MACFYYQCLKSFLKNCGFIILRISETKFKDAFKSKIILSLITKLFNFFKHCFTPVLCTSNSILLVSLIPVSWVYCRLTSVLCCLPLGQPLRLSCSAMKRRRFCTMSSAIHCSAQSPAENQVRLKF